MASLTTRFEKKTDLVTRSIAGETIVVPVTSMVGDLDSIFTLNEVGSLVWDLLDGWTQVDQLVEVIASEFEVIREEAERDIVAFLRCLEEAGLIQPLPVEG